MEERQDSISRQAALDILYDFAGCIIDTPNGDYHKAYKAYRHRLEILPSAQPERTKRIIGKSKNGMTMWYQCESCNEPVDEKDLFCSGCGRKFEDGLLDKQTGGNR